ncbi:hypothetical protein KO500_03525 [Cellulophaga baltica]|uniref:hypothetical protein n=1 Tax=Cellulophaga TaxID=104264 RepID=UPI001C07206D|nr:MULTISPECIES: hypothetical protein [Cellulophaga]MBU2995483.1 hypothetical protein [Cellulophaga baltica]MDO6766877.1 hypothetical protein [Cellulophaga sp. 1_MG-2023]
MNLSKFITSVFCFISTLFILNSQESKPTFVAKNGDGIVQILYREGLDKNEYYQEFLSLNEGKISKGSMLRIGEEYKIPKAAVSYRSLGRKINLTTGVETSIFNPTKAGLKKRDTILNNSVYYLLFDKFNNHDLSVVNSDSENKKTLAFAVAKELLEKGARVFLFEYDSIENTGLGDFVAKINQQYLKHQEEYQRLLVVDVENGFNSSAIIDIAHHQKSEKGKKLSDNLERVFKSNRIKLYADSNNGAPLTEKTSLYLANNALPAMTFITVNSNKNKSMATSSKNKFIDVISTGIQVDYSNIEMED